MNRPLWIALVAALALPTVAHAQQRPPVGQGQDKRELAQDRRETRDDARDARRLGELIRRMDEGRAKNDGVALGVLWGDIRDYVRSELAEGRVEVGRDRAEVARSNAEVKGARRELVRDVAQGRGDVATADDARDLRDDRRDLRDDQADAQRTARRHARRREIAQELQGLHGKVDDATLTRTRGLLVELQKLNGAELREDVRETREDRRELREDRREEREDRREKRRNR